MSKQDLVKAISKESKLKRKKSLKVFDRVFELIAKDLRKKKVVSLEDFGEFRIVRQNLKISKGKNNSVSVIPPKDTIEFNTGSFAQSRNKEKIVSAVSIDLGLSKDKSLKAVSAVFECVIKTVMTENELAIQKFGNFKLCPAKEKGNRKYIRFTPAKKLAVRVNSDFQNLKKIKIKKDLKSLEKKFKEYDVAIPEKELYTDEKLASSIEEIIQIVPPEQRKLISDDLINLHKEITKELKKDMKKDLKDNSGKNNLQS